MARRPGLWRRSADGCWYTTHAGVQHRLDKDRAAAEKAFHALLAGGGPATTRAGPNPPFRQLADLHLGFVHANRKPATYEARTWFLSSFCRHAGALRANDIRGADVTAWLAAETGWGQSTRAQARSCLKACLRWLVAEGLLAANPLPHLKTGPYLRRERILSREEKDRIRAGTRDRGFRDFLAFLEMTGCRPFSEAAALEASCVDFAAGVARFREHKNAHRGKTRTVYLTPDLSAFLGPLCLARPAGPLFTTRTGTPFTRCHAADRCRNLERRLGLPRFSLYAYRHTYVTEALARGLSADLVAALVGSSAQTISRFYDHLPQRADALRAAALRASGP